MGKNNKTSHQVEVGTRRCRTRESTKQRQAAQRSGQRSVGSDLALVAMLRRAGHTTTPCARLAEEGEDDRDAADAGGLPNA